MWSGIGSSRVDSDGASVRSTEGVAEMGTIGRLIVDAIATRDEPAEQARLAAEVRAITARFPVPGLPEA